MQFDTRSGQEKVQFHKQVDFVGGIVDAGTITTHAVTIGADTGE